MYIIALTTTQSFLNIQVGNSSFSSLGKGGWLSDSVNVGIRAASTIVLQACCFSAQISIWTRH